MKKAPILLALLLAATPLFAPPRRACQQAMTYLQDLLYQGVFDRPSDKQLEALLNIRDHARYRDDCRAGCRGKSRGFHIVGEVSWQERTLHCCPSCCAEFIARYTETCGEEIPERERTRRSLRDREQATCSPKASRIKEEGLGDPDDSDVTTQRLERARQRQIDRRHQRRQYRGDPRH